MAEPLYSIKDAASSARQALVRLAAEQRRPELMQLAQDPNDEKVVQAMVALKPEAAQQIEGYAASMGPLAQGWEGIKQGVSMGYWGESPRTAAQSPAGALMETAPYQVGRLAGSLGPLLLGGGALKLGLGALRYGAPLAFGTAGALQSALSTKNELDESAARGATITPEQRAKLIGLSGVAGGAMGLAPAASSMARGALWNALGSGLETAGTDVVMDRPWSQTLSEHPGLALGVPAVLGGGLTSLHQKMTPPVAAPSAAARPKGPQTLPLGADAEALLRQLGGELPPPVQREAIAPMMTAMDLLELQDLLGQTDPARLRQVATGDGVFDILGKSKVKKGFYRGQQGDRVADLSPDDILMSAKMLDLGGQPVKLGPGYKQAGMFRTPRGELLGVTPSGTHAAVFENGITVHGVPVEELQGLQDYLAQRLQDKPARRQGADTRKSLKLGEVDDVLRTKGAAISGLARPLQERMTALDARVEAPPSASPLDDYVMSTLPFSSDELEFLTRLGQGGR